MKLLETLIIAAGLTLTLASAAHAERISFNTPEALKSKCDSSGGTYFPPAGPNSAYGCLGKNGSLVACGGEGEYAKTCDATPPDRVKADVGRLLKLRASVATTGLAPGN